MFAINESLNFWEVINVMLTNQERTFGRSTGQQSVLSRDDKGGVEPGSTAVFWHSRAVSLPDPCASGLPLCQNSGLIGTKETVFGVNVY